jgi:hypothetical protein
MRSAPDEQQPLATRIASQALESLLVWGPRCQAQIFNNSHLSSFLILLFDPQRSPSFRPDPRALMTAARKGRSRMAVAPKSPTRKSFPEGHFLDRPEHGGRLGLVGLTSRCSFRQQRAYIRRSEASLPTVGAKIARHVLVFGRSDRGI